MKKIKFFLVNGIILTFTSLILRTIGMFFNVYISNKIGSESVGIFELVMSVYFFFITFSLSGINLACTRLVSEELAYGNNKNIRLVTKKCLLFSLSFGLFSALILFIFAPFISSTFLHNKVSSFPFYVISLSLPFVSMSSCINGYFSAIRQVKKTAFVQILEQIIKITIICFLLSLLAPESVDFAIISLVVGEAISEACSFFILYFLYKLNQRNLKQTRNSEKCNFSRKILRISIPVAITSYIRSGLSTIKQLLIPLRLEKSGLEYEICPINAHRLNLFFGKKECIDIVRLICNRPLNLLTPEEDFILGTMLGYDVCQQCERYNHRKTLIQSA